MLISTDIPSNPAVGHLVLDPVSYRVYIWSGSQWNVVAPAGPNVVSSRFGPVNTESRMAARVRDQRVIARAVTMIAAIIILLIALVL